MLHQRKYIEDVLRRFQMENCNAAEDVTLFKQVVWSSGFICNTRPDINYVVGSVSRFMSNPKAPHLIAAKRILIYLKGTMA
jgi:hypothetical protein